MPWILLGLVVLGVVVRETQSYWYWHVFKIFNPRISEFMGTIADYSNVRHWGKHGPFYFVSYTVDYEDDGEAPKDVFVLYIGSDPEFAKLVVILTSEQDKPVQTLDMLDVWRRERGQLKGNPLTVMWQDGDPLPASLWIGSRDKKSIFCDEDFDGTYDYKTNTDGQVFEWKEGEGWVPSDDEPSDKPAREGAAPSDKGP